MDYSLKYSLWLGLLFYSFGIWAQTNPPGQENLFDAQHSLQFARYLSISRQYQQAASEYERLVFLHPESDTLKWELIRAYRLSNQASTAWSRYQYFFPLNAHAPAPVAQEMGYTLLQAQMLPELHFFLQSTRELSIKDSVQLSLGQYFMRDQLPECEYLLQQYPTQLNGNISLLITQRKDLRLKSPFLAAGLSAIIPGMGKVYSGRWKDGLFSAIIIGSLGWRTWRFFDKKGISSGYGWGFGAIATGFYVGNIWGSSQAAKKYNFNKKHGLQHQMVDYILAN